MSAPSRRRPRHTFALKAALAAGLIVLADVMLYGEAVGFTLGVFALALGLAAAVAHPPGRDRRAWTALALAAAFGLAQIDHPTLIGLLLFACSLGVAVMSARAGRADDAWRWFQRLLLMGPLAAFSVPLDLRRLVRSQPGLHRRIPGFLPMFVLPLLGGAVFLWLFALANPVIEQSLTGLLDFRVDPFRGVFWGVILILAWGYMRPRLLKKPLPTPGGKGDRKLPGVTVGSVLLSLLIFNGLFALQNGLDIAFLWSGASLPDGMTLADYAHRGAYPLIATALLAGLFVLVALAPGSASARNRSIRGLVVLWIVQNIFLVASTVLRTIDYIDVYSLTRLRIAALVWMGLVAIGLILICWRMLRGKSASWLINANVLAAGIVLSLSAVVDLGAVAASWNVRHAAEVGGRGTQLDLCYLGQLGESALVPLAQLEQTPLEPAFQNRVTWLRQRLAAETSARDANWRAWTWRGARRLAQANHIATHGKPLPVIGSEPRTCDGYVRRKTVPAYPAEPALPPQPPLTSPPSGQ